MTRKQFTFYSSFFTAVSRFDDPAVRGRLYDCICQYALTGQLPEVLLTPSEWATIDVIKPVLEAGRSKARLGQKGGEVSPNASKDKNKIKDKNKNKNKIKDKNKIKHNSDICPAEDLSFDKFWNLYPKKVGKASARKKFDQVDVSLDVLLRAVQEQKMSLQWQDSAFIPNPATWLQERRWEDELPRKEDPIPKGASGLLGEAELRAIEKIMGE